VFFFSCHGEPWQRNRTLSRPHDARRARDHRRDFGGFDDARDREAAGCSPRTVTTQLTALFQKTGVHSQAGLAAFISEGLLSRNLTRGRDFARLTERQTAVVTHAAHGESSKLIAYRLGISRSTVSLALHRAMRELGVKTQAELVAKTHGL